MKFTYKWIYLWKVAECGKVGWIYMNVNTSFSAYDTTKPDLKMCLMRKSY
jgi:hypothetical protein